MAATRLIAIHHLKGKTILQCLRDRINYSQNPEKTKQGETVSYYQCTKEAAAEENSKISICPVWQFKDSVIYYVSKIICQSFRIKNIQNEKKKIHILKPNPKEIGSGRTLMSSWDKISRIYTNSSKPSRKPDMRSNRGKISLSGKWGMKDDPVFSGA